MQTGSATIISRASARRPNFVFDPRRSAIRPDLTPGADERRNALLGQGKTFRAIPGRRFPDLSRRQLDQYAPAVALVGQSSDVSHPLEPASMRVVAPRRTDHGSLQRALTRPPNSGVALLPAGVT